MDQQPNIIMEIEYGISMETCTEIKDPHIYILMAKERGLNMGNITETMEDLFQ
jgi:hypothetical protein